MNYRKLFVISMSVLVALNVVFTVMIASILDSVTNAHRMREVVQLCTQSRNVSNGSLEQRCGDLQDKYDIAFQCTSTRPDAYCWVEAK